MSKIIGIDLGTATVLVYVEGKGIVLNEPSVVAVDTTMDCITKIGKDAQAMLGRNPANIEIVRPLKDGVIADFEITAEMIASFIKKTTKRHTPTLEEQNAELREWNRILLVIVVICIAAIAYMFKPTMHYVNDEHYEIGQNYSSVNSTATPATTSEVE